MIIKNKKIAYGFLVVFGVLNILLWQNSFDAKNDDNLNVYFLDVGQGDAIYFRTVEGQDILIDGGPGSAVVSKLGEVMPYYDKKIEMMILTHAHADHIDGLIDVLRRYEVEQILYTGVETSYAGFLEWKRLIEEKNILVNNVLLGDEIILGQERMEILYPIKSLDGKEVPGDGLNDTSLIARLIYGENEFMFTGDAGSNIEKEILDLERDISADVLKVGHHGSKYSSSLDFLSGVAPKYGIIQVGEKNRYKHPHEETLVNLGDLGVEVFRNDEDGDVHCISNSIDVLCEKLK